MFQLCALCRSRPRRRSLRATDTVSNSHHTFSSVGPLLSLPLPCLPVSCVCYFESQKYQIFACSTIDFPAVLWSCASHSSELLIRSTVFFQLLHTFNLVIFSTSSTALHFSTFRRKRKEKPSPSTRRNLNSQRSTQSLITFPDGFITS